MGYYIRILGVKDPDIHIDYLLAPLKKGGLNCKIEYAENERPEQWTVLNIKNTKGESLVQIERNVVVEGELGKDELNEFEELIGDFKPATAVAWLKAYFVKVKVIYAFQMLNAAFEDANFEIVSSIKATIWNITGGILQADHEGFSNEDGYHILWQFSDDVTGEWSCAVQNEEKGWTKFVMQLGDREQRKQFLNGEVPEKAILV